MDWDKVNDYYDKLKHMAKVVKRENITVVVREYEDNDGKLKKVRRTIGERTTFQGDDGTYFSKGELYHMPGAQIDFFEQQEKAGSDNY